MTGDVEFVEAAPAEYRTQIARAEAGGYRFGGLYASDAGAVVRTILVAPDSQLRLISTRTDDGATSSIVDIFPAAGWDEREAADLYRVGFAGHEPLRPLVRRSDVGAWTVPVTGSGPYQVAVGPIHAGIIESGHFRFHVVGDRILHLDAQLFYKHRGLERAAEGHDLAASQRYLGRACAACSVANTVAYAHACEDVLGLAESAELSRVRTLLLELERTWSHLNDIAAICAGVGLAAGNHRFLALTERARRLNAALTGHRFLFDTVRIGGSDLVIDADQVAAARAELAELRHEARVSWRELIFNASLQDRLSGVGVLTAENAHRLGTVGPAARAAGLAEDARQNTARLAYGPGFRPTLTAAGSGDVQARFDQRALELWQSLDLLDDLLGTPIARCSARPGPSAPTRNIGIARVESARGATLCVVEQAAGRLSRVHLRTGSYANWPTVCQAAADNLLPDFPLINKSFELCYACVDR